MKEHSFLVSTTSNGLDYHAVWIGRCSDKEAQQAETAITNQLIAIVEEHDKNWRLPIILGTRLGNDYEFKEILTKIESSEMQEKLKKYTDKKETSFFAVWLMDVRHPFSIKLMELH